MTYLLHSILPTPHQQLQPRFNRKLAVVIQPVATPRSYHSRTPDGQEYWRNRCHFLDTKENNQFSADLSQPEVAYKYTPGKHTCTSDHTWSGLHWSIMYLNGILLQLSLYILFTTAKLTCELLCSGSPFTCLKNHLRLPCKPPERSSLTCSSSHSAVFLPLILLKPYAIAQATCLPSTWAQDFSLILTSGTLPSFQYTPLILEP